MIFKKNKPQEWNSVEIDELVPRAQMKPVRKWVGLFLIHMHQKSIDSFTLQKSKGIPAFPLDDEVSKEEITFTKIINRLKVMCGLDPVVYSNPQEASTMINICGKVYQIKTTFSDNTEDQLCNIQLIKQ